MRTRSARLLLPVVALASAVVIQGEGRAADHLEAPEIFDDPPADIADFYAWHEDGTFVAIVTWGGYGLPGFPAVYDRDVLYGVHIDTDGDLVPDVDIWARAAEDPIGNWGIQVSQIPGESDPLEGPVETKIAGEQARVWVGLRDDPFFWDREGFLETLTTGTLSFNAERDFALFKNTTALVIEVPLAELGVEGPFSTWSTARRLP